MPNTPRDTRDPLAMKAFFLESMAFGPAGRVEAQEAQGQRELVASEVLPTKLQDGEEGWEKLRSWGFIIGEIVSDDPIFRSVQLPSGWKKKGSDHNMWSSVVDEAEKERISVFYKAAFYDRSAFMRICGEWFPPVIRVSWDRELHYQKTHFGGLLFFFRLLRPKGTSNAS